MTIAIQTRKRNQIGNLTYRKTEQEGSIRGKPFETLIVSGPLKDLGDFVKGMFPRYESGRSFTEECGYAFERVEEGESNQLRGDTHLQIGHHEFWVRGTYNAKGDKVREEPVVQYVGVDDYRLANALAAMRKVGEV